MSHKPPGNDPKSIWQGQALEGNTLSPERLLERARRLDTKMSRGSWIFGFAISVHILCHIGRRFASGPEFTGWIGIIELGTLVVALLYWPYQYAARTRWPLSVVPHDGSMPGLAYYRRQLELQRDWHGQDYSSVLKAISLGFIVAIHAIRYPAFMIPLGVVSAIVFAFLYIRSSRNRSAIQRELDELNVFLRNPH